jgi:hypothetical protein
MRKARHPILAGIVGYRPTLIMMTALDGIADDYFGAGSAVLLPKLRPAAADGAVPSACSPWRRNRHGPDMRHTT